MAEKEKLNIFNLDKYDPNDFFIPITYSINDFRNIESRNGYFTKTIKIPGTKKNDSLLAHAFDITAEGFFDRNKRTRAVIEQDGITYLDGSMQLKRVLTEQGRIVEYELILYGDIADWANDLKNKSIRGLPYSTITYSNENCENSWTNTGDDSEYVFPLINYSGFDGSDKTTNKDATNFRPAIFVYYIFRKIFEGIGYSLKPGFFLKPEMRDLILPYVAEATLVSQDVLDFERVEARSSTEQTFTGNSEETVGNYATINAIDESDNLNETTGVYTSPYAGNYNIRLNIDVNNKRTLFNNDFIVRIRSTVSTSVWESETVTIEPGIINLETFEVNINNYPLGAGVNLYVTVEADGASADYGVIVNDFDITPVRIPIQEGLDYDLIRGVPDISQIEFIKAIIQMFNLMVITDTRGKSIEFVHRDDFYKDISDSDDWTDKLDISKLQELEQIEDSLSRNLLFKYTTDDNDEDVKSFNENYTGQGYANHKEILDNEFLRGSKNVANLPFAPTLMEYILDTGTLHAPRMDNDGFTKELAPRILIYHGLRNGEFTFNSVLKTQYPYCYFHKDPSGEFDVSLSFGNLKDLDASLQESDKGLVDRHYRNQITQINKGRLYTCYLRLNSVDIVNLDFRKSKFINGVYYYLNKAEDYMAGKEDSTKVELIQIP